MTSHPIQDPFDPSEAIMPSGNMGSKMFIAPVGTLDPTRPRISDDWKQIGWIEPSELGFAPPPDTPNQSARDIE